MARDGGAATRHPLNMEASPRYNLAIETSGRTGAIALGRDDGLLATIDLPRQRRHTLELMPTIDRLCRDRGVRPRDLGEVYVSLGPGSFTGLRVALATVKMLALAGGVRVVGIPSIDALRIEHPGAMVLLNIKRGSAYCAGPGHPPALRTLEEIEALAWPAVSDATPGVETIWRLGRTRAAAGDFDDPATLVPAYIREPEAVTLWNERESGNAENRETQ